jgi:AcrR family transcriptional regulator
VSDVIPFTQRSKASLRDGVLSAAAELLADRGYQGLRMADVANLAGVSRQTVYNEFGNKEGLVQAVALQRTAEYLAEVDTRLAAEPDPFEGTRAAIAYVLARTAQDRLVSAVLTGADAEDLLPFLTTKGRPVLTPATEAVARHIRRHWPDAATERVTLIAETTVRLALSYLVMPSPDHRDAVDAIVTIIRALAPVED